MRKLAVLAICSLMMVACSDYGEEVGPGALRPPTSIVEAQRLILGRWSWVKSIHPGNLVSTPVSTGHIVQMEFTADGLVRTFLDGQLSATQTFEIHGRGNDYVLALDGYSYPRFCIEGCYFSFDHREFDGWYALYVRIGGY